MPTTDDPGPLDGLTYAAAEWRRMDAMDFMANGAAGGAVGGIRPGDPGLAVSLVGSAITVTAGVCAAYRSAFGTYRASFPSSTTGLTVSAADPTNPRVDLVYVRIWDNAVDGAGLSQAAIMYLAGTPGVSPVAPTPGALEINVPLATISVPASGGGSPSVNTAARAVTVAPGGISPSGTVAGVYAGQYRDGNGYLERYNGSIWESIVRLNTRVDVGGSGLTAAYSAAGVSAPTEYLKSQVTGDTIARFLATMDGGMAWGPGASTARDVTLTRTGVGQLTVGGSLLMTGVGQTLTAYKTADTARTSTTTVTADPHLSIAIPAAGVWEISAYLNYLGAGPGTGDLKFTLAFSGTVTASGSSWSCGGVLTSNLSGVNAGTNAFGTTTPVGADTLTTPVGAMPTGTLTCSTSGTLTVNWAQNTSIATATTIKQGSRLRATRIA